MDKSTIESRTLQKAAEVLGGRLRLARRLQVPVIDLEKWLTGEERPPRIYFFQAVDLIVEQDAQEHSLPGAEVVLQREIEKKLGDRTG